MAGKKLNTTNAIHNLFVLIEPLDVGMNIMFIGVHTTKTKITCIKIKDTLESDTLYELTQKNKNGIHYVAVGRQLARLWTDYLILLHFIDGALSTEKCERQGSLFQGVKK